MPSTLVEIPSKGKWYAGALPPESQFDHFTVADRRVIIQVEMGLGFLKTAVEELKTSVEKGASETVLRINGIDGRLRQLENFRWWILGAAAAAGFIGNQVIEFLKISRHV